MSVPDSVIGITESIRMLLLQLHPICHEERMIQKKQMKGSL